MTLTRDRLPYTQHCFKQLDLLAGCDYDHYVLDQNSVDGTADWLWGWRTENPLSRIVHLMPANVGISRGLNLLLDEVARPHLAYDIVVKFDNDCEPLTNNILRDISDCALRSRQIVAPTILGLNNPMPTVRYDNWAGHRVRVTGMVGGIFMAVPANIFSDGFRFDEAAPVWGMDDSLICQTHRCNGGECGYLADHRANHYLTTKGQHADIPDYFLRTLLEGKPAL